MIYPLLKENFFLFYLTQFFLIHQITDNRKWICSSPSSISSFTLTNTCRGSSRPTVSGPTLSCLRSYFVKQALWCFPISLVIRSYLLPVRLQGPVISIRRY